MGPGAATAEGELIADDGTKVPWQQNVMIVAGS
jgi:hypothetical protein